MKKQLFFLHSGGPQGKHEGSGELVAWLEAQLGPEYELRHPIMPHPEAPDYEAWKPHLREALSRLHDGAQLIGHSLGGSLLLKYLAEEKISFSIGTLFLVSAPFWGGDEDWQHPAFQCRLFLKSFYITPKTIR
jgi:predicted alpha/beta hydrolase family esterase